MHTVRERNNQKNIAKKKPLVAFFWSPGITDPTPCFFKTSVGTRSVKEKQTDRQFTVDVLGSER